MTPATKVLLLCAVAPTLAAPRQDQSTLAAETPCVHGLPGRDGNDLIREVRIREAVASQARTPAIALTAFTRQQDRRAAIESGFDAVCGKPLRLQELMSAIENVLGPLQ